VIGLEDDIVIKWIRKAEDYLKVSHLLGIEEISADILCFHIHQAIEKFLKAYLLGKGLKIDETHNLEFLLALCAEQDREFEKIDKERIAKLTLYVIDLMHPKKFLNQP